MKFRTRPVEIEAFQYTEEIDIYPRRAPDWAQPFMYLVQEDLGSGIDCQSKQGPVHADIGDWIIRELDGSGVYPCKPDVFEKKYEPVQWSNERIVDESAPLTAEIMEKAGAHIDEHAFKRQYLGTWREPPAEKKGFYEKAKVIDRALERSYNPKGEAE